MGATGPRVSERTIFLRDGLREGPRNPPRGTLVMKIKSQKGLLRGFRRPLLSETLRLLGDLVNFTLPGLCFHELQTRVFFSLALSDPCTLPSSPVPRPFLARSSPALARPSPGPRLALAHPRFKQSSRQTGKREIYYGDPTEIPPLSRDRCSRTPVALCFLWYHRLSLLHPRFFP